MPFNSVPSATVVGAGKEFQPFLHTAAIGASDEGDHPIAVQVVGVLSGAHETELRAAPVPGGGGSIVPFAPFHSSVKTLEFWYVPRAIQLVGLEQDTSLREPLAEGPISLLQSTPFHSATAGEFVGVAPTAMQNDGDGHATAWKVDRPSESTSSELQVDPFDWSI
jgi:hypothetical protein